MTEKAWPGVEAARSDLDLLPTLARELKRRGDKATERGELRSRDLYTACLDTGFPREEASGVRQPVMCYLKRGEPGTALNDAMAAAIDAKEWPGMGASRRRTARSESSRRRSRRSRRRSVSRPTTPASSQCARSCRTRRARPTARAQSSYDVNN